MSWPGKADAIRAAQKQSVATLLPVENESVDFESTGNVIIEGDNLEVLKLLQKSYLGKIKMIYIDPPYNTGKDFIYPDNYSESLQTYLEYTGQVDDEGKRFSTNTETDGRFHSKWMSMMYPRLVLARNLLTEDGLVFISIDDNEVKNLLAVCDEVFGELNRICVFTRESIRGGSIAKHLRVVHDYVLCYARQFDSLEFGSMEGEILELDQEDSIGKFRLGRELNKWGAGSRREDAPGMWFPIRGPKNEDVFPIRNDGSEGRWRLGKDRMKSLVESKSIEFVARGDGTYICYEKIREARPTLRQFTTLLSENFVNAKGTESLKRLFESERAIFDFSKPVELIETLLVAGLVEESQVVLDFFAGSGTTGHAVLAQNAKDGGSRRFILVQLPEPVEEGSEAAKAGFESIADITKERVRRAAKEIAKEAGGVSKLKKADGSGPQDLGFRVFRLDKSNFQVWDAAAPAGDVGKLQEQLALQVEHVVEGRKGLDVVFEVLLKSKLPLTSNVEKLQLGAGEVWSVNGGVLLVVVDEGFDVVGVRELAKRDPKPESVVFLDRCFGGKDSLKANARKIFQDANIEFKTI